MRIGIEAKWFYNGPPSGRIVIRNLIEYICKGNKEHDIYIFLGNESKNEVFPFKGEKIHLKYIWAKNNLISNLFVLPYLGNKLKLDCILFQNFSSLWGKYKKICYIHDVLFLSYPQYYTRVERLYFFPLKYIANKSDLILTISESERNRLLEHGINVTTKVIYHGVSDKFKTREEVGEKEFEEIKNRYNLPKEYILYVGRLNVRKNILNLLKALSLMTENIPLVIVGKKDWKTIKNYAFYLTENIKNKVIFTGPIDDKDLIFVYAHAKIFCFPSYAEGFGLPAIEAMASGIPIVVSNTTSLPEVCADAGNYINPNDPSDIAQKIDELLRNKDLYQKKRKSGLLRSKEFRWEASAKNLINEIEILFKKDL